MTAKDQNQSEIARLRQSIAEQYQVARRGLHGVAAPARHDFITKRMQPVNQQFEQLTELVGSPTAAMALVVESLTANADKHNASATFLQIGTVLINPASIVWIQQEQDDGAVLIDTIRNESHMFHGEEAALFLRLLKQHCQIVQ